MEKTVKKIISTMVDVSPKTMDELKKMDISDPQKAIDFVVRVAFAQIDHINDGIDDIKKLDIANTLSKISSTQILYQELCENSRIAEHNYNEIHIKIIEAINELKNLKLVIVIKYNSKDQKFEILEKELLSIFKTIVLRQPKGEFNENKKNI
ncbi:MAG: hypothetical protein IJZ27_00585 [Treponema sp.]|nr:hypothetical protein [Treponema sp.]